MAPESLQEIHKLFSWNPPPLVLDRTRKPSISTRPPSFFDKHISRNLALKRVQRLPSLVQDLSRNVDTALTAALNTLPPLDGFITAQQRADDIWTTPPTVTGENGVADFYDKTTAKYCSRVASTLALHPTASFSRWISLLFWTQSVSPSDYAIIHRQLCFLGEKGLNETQKTLREALVERMDSKTRRIFEEMAKSRSPLGTWEMRSISAGSVDVMAVVPNLGNFSWTTCSKKPNHQKQKVGIAQLLVGPDALAPPWSFSDSLNTLQPPVHQRLDLLQSRVLHSERTVNRSKKRERDNDNGEHAPTNSKGKGRRQRDNDDGDGDDDGDDQHDISAHSLVQQAWAQAVNVDGTVIVLHSGNHELVCIRHRASQTLYVSDIIEPPNCVNPGYGKLHVGIYLAAIQDAMDRKQQPQPNPPGDSGDLIGGDKDQDDKNDSGSGPEDGRGHRGGKRTGGHGLGKSGGIQGSAGKSGPADEDELVAIEKMIDIVSKCDVIFLYLQYNVYDSPVPASFLRSAPSIMAHTRCPTPPFSPGAVRTYGLEECQTIVLTSEIGHGATGVVLRGTLKPEIWDDAGTLDVVVKLAFDAIQRDALRGEHEVYRHLWSKGVHQGIATPLGFFDDSEGSACALVMPYAGIPLSELRGNLSTSERESALSILESIHRAGILHGDIRPENILLGDSGVTIIDFGHSIQFDNQRAKDKEFARLRRLVTSCSV